MIDKKNQPEQQPDPRTQSSPWAGDPGYGEIYGPQYVGSSGPGRSGAVYGPSHAAPSKRLDIKKKRKIWPWVLIIFAVLLFGSCAAILSTARNNSGDSLPVRVAPVPSQAIESSSVTTSEEPVNPGVVYGQSFGPGEWLVGKGKEVEPGDYRTAGPETGQAVSLCYADTTPVGGGSIIEQKVSNQGPARIKVKEDQIVKTNGCQLWKKVG